MATAVVGSLAQKCCLCICLYHVSTYVNVSLSVSLSLSLYIYIYMHIRIVCVCIYIYIFIYIHAHVVYVDLPRTLHSFKCSSCLRSSPPGAGAHPRRGVGKCESPPRGASSRRASLKPRGGSKYPTVEVSGSQTLLLNGFWSQKPQ